MKNISNLFLSLLLVSLSFCSKTLKAQGIAINENNTIAAPSAILDLSSTDKGFLLPRMRTADRLALSTPAEGLLVFDTDYSCFAVYKTNAWYLICGTLDPLEVRTLNILSGDGQSACAASTLSNSIILQLVDGNGTPVNGEQVDFFVTSGGGTLSATSQLTNSNGEVAVDWRTGSVGAQLLTANSTKASTTSIAATVEPTVVSTSTLVDARDGNSYTTVRYCNGQTWTTQNLNYGSIGQYNPANPSASYGRLYTWAEVMNAASPSATAPSGVQGICPTGWHLPSDMEWKTLEQMLGMNATTANLIGWRGANEGQLLMTTNGWSSGNGTNTTSFSVFPAGYYRYGNFSNFGFSSCLWSSAEYSLNNGWGRIFHYTKTSIYRHGIKKTRGCSCRCVKD